MVGTNLISAVQASRHVFELIDIVPKLGKNVKKNLVAYDLNSGIRFRNVDFSYPTRSKAKIFDEMSLEVKSGTVVALVGPSGTGKSTLASLLQRFYDPQDGRIEFDGVNIKEMDPEFLRDQIGVVSQEPTLFALSILENIRYGCPDATKAQVEEAAKQANAHNFIENFPDGYDTILGERGVSVSGGQKQRIAIARAILKNPRVLILDEATSALDGESEYLVQQALSSLMEGRTVIVIAHRLSTVKDADQILVFGEQGRIIEKGTHYDLLQRESSVYGHLFRRQQATKRKT